MKRYAQFLIVVTVLGLSPVLRAQSTPSIHWKGDYNLSVPKVTVTCAGPPTTSTGTCTVSHDVAATSNFTAGGGLSVASPADVVTSSSLSDTGEWPTSECGTLTETAAGTTGGGTSLSELRIDVSKGTFEFLPAPTENVKTSLSDTCTSGSGSKGLLLSPVANWPLTFTLPATVRALTVKDFSFKAEDEGVTTLTFPWTLSFTLTPTASDDCGCNQDEGPGAPVSSSIGSQNQSLGEDVHIVGTDFNLHYEGDRASGAGANNVASADAAMIGGWTLSVHHAYDGGSSALFLGDGSQRNGYQLGIPAFFNGDFLVTSQDGSEVYVFSLTGQHLQTLRPLTGALEYEFGYDTAGKLATVTDASGNITKIQRDSSEHPTAIVSPYGQSTALKVDSNGFLSEVTDPLGKSVTFVNTSAGLLTSRTDENGNRFNYSYDGEGGLAKDADPLGGFIELTRRDATSGLGWTVGQTTSMGRSSSYQTTFSMPWVQTSTSTFSEQHADTWPNGLKATETKTQHGSQISESVILPDGTSSSDTLGPDPVWGIQVPIATSRTVSEGNLTMNISGSSTASLGTFGNPFSLVTRTDKATVNNRTYSSVFTAVSRTFVDSTPVGRKLTTVLDNHERISSTQIEGLLANDFVYDTRGRLSTVTQGTRTTTLEYDSDGRLATATDPLGLKNTFSYDADGHLLSTTLADGRIVEYRYDANGNLTSVIPPGKSAHDFDYTAVNQMSEYMPPSVPGAGSTTYSYNTDRDVTKITRPDGKIITFDYDKAGRLSSLVTPSETVDYAYSLTTGNLTGASISSGEALVYSYNYNGPLPTSTSWTGTVKGSVGLSYNDDFWVTSENINGANAIAFSYDIDGLVTAAGALALNRSSQNGLITGSTQGLTTDSRTYNSFGELTVSAKGAAVYNVTYTRDADGRISGETETIGGQKNAYVYSYDLAGRLIGVTENGKTISTYTYDTNSNRLKATISSGTVRATYDAQDRLLTYGSGTYSYTANGELESQAVGAQKTVYQYDVLGNLVSITLPSAKAISYVVDAKNRRVGKKVNGALVEGFLWDGDRVVAQLNGSNQLISQFVYATGSNSPDYMISGGVTYRLFSDQRGSPRLVVSTSTGAVAEEITYDEFGNVIADTDPGFQPFGFAGGLYDQDTKLVRFRARDYNPSVGRWTAKDPVLFGGSDSNLYGYVLNNPVNITDSLGLQADAGASDDSDLLTPLVPPPPPPDLDLLTPLVPPRKHAKHKKRHPVKPCPRRILTAEQREAVRRAADKAFDAPLHPNERAWRAAEDAFNEP